MNKNEFYKDPNATLDYQIDWSDWLGTDTISSSDWTVPTGITEATHTNTTTTSTIWLSGGTAGNTYECINRIVTADSPARTDDRTIYIIVENK
jgi:hypothetical protein